MEKDTQSRKWQLTINNPIDKGFTHDEIKNKLSHFKSLVYWCMSDEVGLNGQTPHTHIFLCASSGVRFSTLLKHFEGAHIEFCRGTAKQNRDYVFKVGKLEGSEKEHTRIDGTQEEWGELPLERQGQRTDLIDVFDMIRTGYTDYDILRVAPDQMLNLADIQKTRLIIQQEQFKSVFRNMSVTYIWGPTGTGKTRYVMEKYGYENVYRVTNYKNPFDGYKAQDVLLFDEFRSNLPISDMLKYLDGYPVDLPCRFSDKHACFTKVYFTTNISLDRQYETVQREERETYRAFVRRIHNTFYFGNDGDRQLNLDDFTDCAETPFH